MPWSKNAEEAKTLKSTIESSKRSISYQESQLALRKTMMADKLSDAEEKMVTKFRELDEKMDRVNEDLHIREHTRDIKMREKWIHDQEVYMQKDKETGGKEADTFAKRYEQIAKWKEEIEGYKKRIADYQKAHPDFVLNPSDNSAPAKEQKKAA
jgi:phage host-nuclease inhibitor protein Gam